jgi:hypothetical protein
VPLLLFAVVLACGGATSVGSIRWLAWAATMAVLAVMGRGWVIRVEDHDGGVRVVNWTRTVEVSWSELDRFECEGGIAARRTNLTTLPLSAFPSPSRDIFGIAQRRNETAFRALEASRKRRQQRAHKRGRP